MGVQIDVKILPSTAGSWKNILSWNDAPVVSWFYGETWFDNGKEYVVTCHPPEGYEFDHFELISPTGYTSIVNERSNPMIFAPIFEANHEGVLNVVLGLAGMPPVTTGNVTAQFNQMDVYTTRNGQTIHNTWFDVGTFHTVNVDENSDVIIDFTFTNVSPDAQVHGYRLALEAISDDPDASRQVIYDPNIVGNVNYWNYTAYNSQKLLKHTIQLIKYGANVEVWLEGLKPDTNSAVTVIPLIGKIRFKADTGVLPPYEPFKVPSIGDPFGDDMFWVYALIVLIIMISVLGVSKYRKWI